MKKALDGGLLVPWVVYIDQREHLQHMEYIDHSMTMKQYLNLLIQYNMQQTIQNMLTTIGTTVR